MKVSFTALLAFVGNHLNRIAVAEVCAPDPLEIFGDASLQVTKVGSVPAPDVFPFSYNMQPMDNFDGNYIYFLDQKNGIIYSFDVSSYESKAIFDIAESPIPDGLVLDWDYIGASQTYKVKAMTKGSTSNEIIIVFTSSTLPTGWTEADATLPPPGTFGKYACGNEINNENITWIEDIYRVGIIPECFEMGGGTATFTGYDVFYRYTLSSDGELSDPDPFFVSESNVAPGHLGGGIATIEGGKILWSTGDCTVFGTDGVYAPQLDHEACGKILLINPDSKSSFSVVAKGVRNSQQMRIITLNNNDSLSPFSGILCFLSNVFTMFLPQCYDGQYLVFMDIGGVTAEEVNAYPLSKIIDISTIENFGWGRNLNDGKAREGTFYINSGNPGVLGTEPACAEDAPIGESGFVQPWIQFGRTEIDYFYAISSLAVPSSGISSLKLLWSEFNTGLILGTDEQFIEGQPPVTGYKITLYDKEGNVLANGLNDLVQEELGDVGYYRGDPRLFHFPDGNAGVFIERTGAIYKLTENT